MTDSKKVEEMDEAARYRAFRNFMFNELGVTKEDLKMWILEAVQQQVAQTLTEQKVSAAVSQELHTSARKAVRDALGVSGYGNSSTMVTRLVAETLKGKLKVVYED